MDPITLAVVGHAFAATAEEMGVNLYRSAHSTIVREVRDIATAILDPYGRTVAIANYIPQLLNAMDPAAPPPTSTWCTLAQAMPRNTPSVRIGVNSSTAFTCCPPRKGSLSTNASSA